MSKIDNSGPAFPIVAGNRVYVSGLSIRDYFAVQAIVGLIGNSEAVHAGAEPTNSCLFGQHGKEVATAYANSAFLIADALLAARTPEDDNG